MSDQWMIRGSEFTNCNCAIGCPCQFNAPSTSGTCEGIGNAKIEEGHFNDISLDGLSFVVAARDALVQRPGNHKKSLNSQ